MSFSVFDKGAGCEKDQHAWEPVAPEPGRAGFTRYHCRVCGETKAMDAGGVDDPNAALLARVEKLEADVAELKSAKKTKAST